MSDIKVDAKNKREPHALSEPLTGAIFDIFVEVYQELLVKNNLISKELSQKSFNDETIFKKDIEDEIQGEFDSVYIGKEQEFKENLLNARDYLGKLLSQLWKSISPNDLTYNKILENMIKIENKMSQTDKRESYENIIKNCFEWREISLEKRNVLFMVHHKYIN